MEKCKFRHSLLEQSNAKRQTKTKRKSFTNFRHKNDEMADCEKSHSDPPRFIYSEEKMKRRNRKKFYPNIYFV